MGAGLNRQGKPWDKRGQMFWAGNAEQTVSGKGKRCFHTSQNRGLLYQHLERTQVLPSKKRQTWEICVGTSIVNTTRYSIMKLPTEGARNFTYIIQFGCPAELALLLPFYKWVHLCREHFICPNMFSVLNIIAKLEPRLPDSRPVVPCSDRMHKKDT